MGLGVVQVFALKELVLSVNQPAQSSVSQESLLIISTVSRVINELMGLGMDSDLVSLG